MKFGILIASFFFAASPIAWGQSTHDDLSLLKALLEDSCKADARNYIVLSATTEIPTEHQRVSDLAHDAWSDLMRRNKTVSLIPTGLECDGVKVMAQQAVSDAIDRQKRGVEISRLWPWGLRDFDQRIPTRLLSQWRFGDYLCADFLRAALRSSNLRTI